MNPIACRAGVPGLGLLFVLVVGCGGGGGLPPETSPDVARSSLTAALDAWKDGNPPESLRDLQPPVDFRDVNWDKGSRLSKYVIKSEERSGASMRFSVELHLQQKDGSSRERTVNYTADAGTVVVIRPDF